MPDQKVVKLKNGSEELEVGVKVIMALLRKMWEKGEGVQGALMFYELVEVCKDSTHKPFGKLGDDLKELTLLSEGIGGKYHVHDTIRNIVLSAAEGEGLDLRMGNPIAT